MPNSDEAATSSGGNSGLGICYSGSGDPSENGLEIQMLDDDGNPGFVDNRKCGAIYQLVATKPGQFKRWPEWNKFHVTSTENSVRVELNGVLVTHADRSQLKQNFPKHLGAARTSGKVCLFPHTARSEYREFRIRSLDQKPTGTSRLNTPAFQQWMKNVAAMPAEQVRS